MTDVPVQSTAIMADALATFITDYFDEHLATAARWAIGANNVTFAEAIIQYIGQQLTILTSEVERMKVSVETITREREATDRENTTLRAIASKIMPCHYCGAKEIGLCPHGFPGCSLADDVMIFDSAVNAELRAANARVKELESKT